MEEKNKGIYEILLGALFHDIGKFMQRASESLNKLASKNEIEALESMLCPKHPSGYHTHRHAIYTDIFFDKAQSLISIFKDLGLNEIKIRNIAKYHHKPEDSLSLICSIADRYSSGMDRRESDEPQDYMDKQMYKKTPMLSIFSEVVIDEKLGLPDKQYYDLTTLNPYSETIFPKKMEIAKDDELPKKYSDLWTNFLSDLDKISRINYLSTSILEEILLGLFEKYMWCIPSSTLETPDISLYDHLRTTAAIATCIYIYQLEKNHLDNEESIKDLKDEKFRFLAGDLSGIQQTLFTLSHQGVKGVNKILRARSFMLTALVESAAIQCIRYLQLPYSNIIQQAGGRFLILLPNTSNIEQKIIELRKRFDAWMVENYTGTLSINLGLSSPFSGEMFIGANLTKVMSDLSNQIELAKLQPLSFSHKTILQRQFPFDTACKACGIRPAEIRESLRCKTCEREFNLGEKLTKDEIMMFWYENNVSYKNHFAYDILGLNLIIDDYNDNLRKDFISCKRLSPEIENIFAIKYIANYIPRFSNDINYERSFYRDEDELSDIYKDMPKTFAHIALKAKEEIDGKYLGKPFLALLKADVDFLGFIFSYGLKDKQNDKMTLSRVAQLSRMLDLYFTGYLQHLIKQKYPDTYTIYAGGDDLLLLGPWRQMLDLTNELNKTFKKYTGNNPSINISAGLSLMHSNYPVNRAVENAEEFLELSKNNGRNSVCAIIDKPMKWDRYEDRLKDADWINDKIRNNLSISFIFNLMKILDDAEKIKIQSNNREAIDINKANWLARLAYHLSRNIKDKNKKEKDKKISEWLERLGIDSMLKIKKDASLYDWRLPLTIALYRNRK